MLAFVAVFTRDTVLARASPGHDVHARNDRADRRFGAHWIDRRKQDRGHRKVATAGQRHRCGAVEGAPTATRANASDHRALPHALAAVDREPQLGFGRASQREVLCALYAGGAPRVARAAGQFAHGVQQPVFELELGPDACVRRHICSIHARVSKHSCVPKCAVEQARVTSWLDPCSPHAELRARASWHRATRSPRLRTARAHPYVASIVP